MELNTITVQADTLCRLGDYVRGIALYEKALQLQPSAVVYNNCGAAYRELGRADKAIEFFKQAVALDKTNPVFCYNLALALMHARQYDDAIICFRQALRFKPDWPQAANELANAYALCGNLEAAEKYFKEAAAAAPHDPAIQSSRLFFLNYLPTLSQAELYTEHCKWGKSFAVNPAPALPDRPRNQKIRVGFISADFYQHPIASFLEPIFTAHDRSCFEYFCYSDTAHSDAITARLRNKVFTWRDVRHSSHTQVAQIIATDTIDILIDLAGHSAHNRLPLFALRTAPVQAGYLGYCNTSGIAQMDYYFTDAISDPPGNDQFYTEKLVRLEHGFSCFLPPDHAPEITGLPALKNGFITFGSLHNPARLNREVIALWSRVLRAIPLARLIIFRTDFQPSTQQYLRGLFAENKIAPGRIDFRSQAPGGSYLSMYDAIDCSLDTFPWSGHTTACEGLWMGVPMITLPGKRHAGRMVASVLTQIGLTDFIAKDENGFVGIAKKLSDNLSLLRNLRASLRQIMQDAPLCKGAHFMQSFEKALCGLIK